MEVFFIISEWIYTHTPTLKYVYMYVYLFIYSKQRIFYENVNFSPSTAYFNGPVKNTAVSVTPLDHHFFGILFPRKVQGSEILPALTWWWRGVRWGREWKYTTSTWRTLVCNEPFPQEPKRSIDHRYCSRASPRYLYKNQAA